MYKLVSVDSWFCEDQWTWNAWYPESQSRFAGGSLPATVAEFCELLENECGLLIPHSYEGLSLDVDMNCEHGNVCLCEEVEDEELGDNLPPRPIYALIWAGNA